MVNPKQNAYGSTAMPSECNPGEPQPSPLTTPYWWETSPRPATVDTALPSSIDVAIVGSGYTGLCAALQVARAGRSVAVIDANDAGWGCSSRNGGQISTSVKPSLESLARKHGKETAFSIIREGQNALSWIEAFVAEEALDCNFQVCGRFHAAHTPAHYEQLADSIAIQPAGLAVPAHAVPRAEQYRELGTESYFGGVVYENHASLDPGRYHLQLLQRVEQAGTQIITRCRVNHIEPSGMHGRAGGGFTLSTAGGTIKARDVIVATNGYTSGLTPWLAQRVIPIGSYIIATEPISPPVMDRIMPTNRILSDTRRVVYYFRPSPDRQRILFGGRVTSGETDLSKSAARLKSELVGLFPELHQTRVTHSWMGFVAYTFDTLAHIGQHNGIHYAMGYCGSGVSMASYLGTRVGQQLLGKAEGRTAFDNIGFPTRPLYRGKPWFLPATVAYYRWRDRSQSLRAARR